MAAAGEAGAQRVRLQRTLWGSASHLCILVIGLAYYLVGFVSGTQLAILALLTLIINLGFIGAILSGINLWSRDPSLTFPQLFCAPWPAVYIMYFVSDPQARTAPLLMGLVALMFGAFSMSFRRLATLAGVLYGGYLLMVIGLYLNRSPHFEVRAELLIMVAYGLSLLMVARLGSLIADLRRHLRERNRELEATMRELTELATLDPLTRLPNRRFLMEQLEKESARMARRGAEQAALCVCMLDIDHFKRFNDTYGHQVGDAVLCAVASSLQGALRQSDVVGRFGGEEFLLLFTECSADCALKVAERVRRAVATVRVPELGAHGPVTVSMGIALHRPGDDMDDSLRRSDEALYQAKAQGRNRVVLAEPLALNAM